MESEKLRHRQKDAYRKRKYRETNKQSTAQTEQMQTDAEQILNEPDRTIKRRKTQTVTQKYIDWQGLEYFDETKVSLQTVGPMNYVCSECGAFMFKGEKSSRSLITANKTASFAIRVPPLKEPPEILKTLLTSNTNRDHDFRENVRAYNSSLAFASMQLTGEHYKFKKKGPYCFRINGQVYHSISHMLPETGKKPSFSQIYIYDQQNELNNRLCLFSDLDRSSFDIKLVLKTTGKTIDPHRYNLPTGTDVAVIMPTDSIESSKRDIVVLKSAAHHLSGQFLMKVDTEHRMYDPLMYDLMFPFGDKGWELGCFNTRKNKQCTAMQYYKDRLMPQSGETFNTIHRMGRLFQQFIVDMYAKIKHGRLQYIRYHQAEL